jgi:hypothetical protein
MDYAPGGCWLAVLVSRFACMLFFGPQRSGGPASTGPSFRFWGWLPGRFSFQSIAGITLSDLGREVKRRDSDRDNLDSGPKRVVERAEKIRARPPLLDSSSLQTTWLAPRNVRFLRWVVHTCPQFYARQWAEIPQYGPLFRSRPSSGSSSKTRAWAPSNFSGQACLTMVAAKSARSAHISSSRRQLAAMA